ncbi:hypothetical protein DL96DRAFT_1707547 [Flagelloscypha sp. PMI_526]|nr:hypothetical protein DL96DRAFT_1707547 [Flagelloscypha sp. PMI_526]
MTKYDIQVLDTLDTPEHLKGELQDEDLDIPSYLIPPNPDDSESLPSRTHPAYPYGNPTHIKHPAARPRPPFDPASRALFEDMGYSTGDVNMSHRWTDLATDQLLPLDPAKEEAARAAEARRLAAGATNNPHPTPSAAPQQPDTTMEEDEDGDVDVDSEGEVSEAPEEDADEDEDGGETSVWEEELSEDAAPWNQ